MKHPLLKRNLVLAASAVLFIAGGLNAQVAPGLQWRGSCEPHTVADNALVVDLGADPAPGEPQKTEESGEDWWYDIIPFDASGSTKGYMLAGYASWVNIDFDETAFTDGLFDANVGGPDIDRPILAGEQLSTKLATLSRYNKHGKMMWEKSYCIAEEGAMSVIATSDGGFAFTGWGKATVDVNGNHLLYNPEVGGVNFDMTNPAFAIENRGPKMLVGKVDSDGNLLWLNAYGYYDMSASPSPTNYSDFNAMKTKCIGYDLVEMSNGNIRAVGHSGEASGTNTQKVFMIDIDQNGMVVDKVNNKKLFGLSNYKSSAREIEPSSDGNSFFITGLQLNGSGSGLGNLNKSDAILFKVDMDMDQVAFGNDTWDGNALDGSANKAAVRYSEGKNNVGWDVKSFTTPTGVKKLAWAFIEKCNNCQHSGENEGQGRIFVSDEDGTTHYNFIDLQAINTVGFTQVQAFDMKMGLIATSSGGFACVTSIKGDKLDAAEEALRTLIRTDLESKVGDGIVLDDKVDSYWNTDAYVAKFDGGGNLVWDKTWDAFDGPAEYYPGDYKEQECVYRILEDHDGGLVITGNNSRNKDDYYVAKILSDCPQSVLYDIEPLGTSNTIDITGTVNWDISFAPSGVLKVRGELHIKPGATLNIDGITVEFADSRAMEDVTKVYIEQGGRINVKNGAVLTSLSECDGNMWDGIEVWGNSSLSQTTSNQGWLSVTSGAIIENAHQAVSLWKTDHWAQTGGVIQASNSMFRNNRRDVGFIHYKRTTGSGFEIPNKSFFSNVVFTWNDDFKHFTPLNHVTLYKVNGVQFAGCDFKDERTAAISNWIKKKKALNCGIYSIDANYTVKGKCTDWVNNCPGNIGDPNLDPSTFTNLDFGIYASNVSSTYGITVDRSIFNNNLYGVQLKNVQTPTIGRNEFRYELSNNKFLDSDQYGIHADGSKGLRIEENRFENIDATNRVTGVLCTELGDTEERIYKNTFKNLYIGHATQGKNRSSDGFQGLQFLCAKNYQNDYDHYVKGTLWDGASSDANGVRTFNGSLSVPSGTQFTQTDPGHDYYHYYNGSNHFVGYYYYNGDPFELPDEVTIMGGSTSEVFTIASPNQNSCASTFPTYPVELELSPLTYAGLSSEFTVSNSNYISKKQYYASLINGGNTSGLLQTIASMTASNRSQIKQQLDNYSPYITEEVIKAVLDYPSSVYPHDWGYDLVVANIDVAYSNDFIEYLRMKSDPMPRRYIAKITQLVGAGAKTSKVDLEGLIAEAGARRGHAVNLFLTDIANDSLKDLDSLRYWLGQRNDPYSAGDFIDSYFQEGDFNAAASQINTLYSSIQSYPQEMQTKMSELADFKALLLQRLSTPGAIANLNENDLQKMRAFANHSSRGTASIQAQELLCFFYGECGDNTVSFEGKTKSNKTILSSEILEKEMQNEEVKLYPNPAFDQVVLELPELKEEVNLSVMSLTGQVLYQQTISNSKIVLQTSKLKSGTYFINVQFNSGKHVTKKLIVQ